MYIYTYTGPRTSHLQWGIVSMIYHEGSISVSLVFVSNLFMYHQRAISLGLLVSFLSICIFHFLSSQ